MSLEAPILTTQEVCEELRRILGDRLHAVMDTVIFGRTSAADVVVTLGGRDQPFHVVPVTCELALRDALAEANSTPVAVVMDYGLELPLDISCRVARMRVNAPDRAQRLVHRLAHIEGSQRMDVSAALLRSPLANLILSSVELTPRRFSSTVIGLGDAWRALLADTASVPFELTLTFDRVLEQVATSARPQRLTALLDAAAGRRSEFEAWLTSEVGRPALQAWTAWERGSGAKVAGLAVLMRAVRDHYTSNQFLRGWLASPLQTVGVAVDGEADVVIWADAGQSLLLRLDAAGNTAQVTQLLQSASALVPQEDVREVLADSTWLPFAFEIQKRRLAAALRQTASTRSLHAQQAARDAWRALREHREGKLAENRPLVSRIEAALRLLAWLDRPVAPHSRGVEAAASYASEYAREGGFVDRARRDLRAETGTDELGLALRDVLRRADEARDTLDRSFATALAAWSSAGRPLANVLPIEFVLERVAARFLDQNAQRKLLVLVLDGLSWTVAGDLLDGWQAREISPVVWSPDGFAEATLVPALAALPTVTEVSRSALFAGRRMARGGRLYSAGDPERFAHHPALCRHVTRAGGPTLLLRGRLEGPGGTLLPEVQELMRSPDRVVGCVVNAIDDDLDGTTQAKLVYTPDDLPLVGELLAQAFAAGRHVLLTSDHGHVPGARLTYRQASDTRGARWRQVGAKEPVAADEIALSGDCVWLPDGAERVALLTSETTRYSTAARAGEHGGATLAEVVIPVVLLTNSELERECCESDPALRQIPIPQPAWWQLEGQPEQPAPKPAKGSQPSSRKTTPPLLPGLTESTGVAAGAAQRPSAAREMIVHSHLYQSLGSYQREQLDAKVLPWLVALESAGGQMSADRFAHSVGALPMRVAGMVSLMQELLGMDGYVPITFDATTRELKLHMDLLKQLWGG